LLRCSTFAASSFLNEKEEKAVGNQPVSKLAKLGVESFIFRFFAQLFSLTQHRKTCGIAWVNGF
jgi:hypothetical protein